MFISNPSPLPVFNETVCVFFRRERNSSVHFVKIKTIFTFHPITSIKHSNLEQSQRNRSTLRNFSLRAIISLKKFILVFGLLCFRCDTSCVLPAQPVEHPFTWPRLFILPISVIPLLFRVELYKLVSRNFILEILLSIFTCSYRQYLLSSFIQHSYLFIFEPSLPMANDVAIASTPSLFPDNYFYGFYSLFFSFSLSGSLFI